MGKTMTAPEGTMQRDIPYARPCPATSQEHQHTSMDLNDTQPIQIDDLCCDHRSYDALLEDASQALFRLGRAFSRQPMTHRFAERGGRAVELSRIMVVQAVEHGETEAEEVTVGTVAEQLGIDPSTASRLVADAVSDGYVERLPSEHDGRRARLALSEQGRALAEDARRYQRMLFDRITCTWTAEERRTFARLFARFVEGVREAQESEPPD